MQAAGKNALTQLEVLRRQLALGHTLGQVDTEPVAHLPQKIRSLAECGQTRRRVFPVQGGQLGIGLRQGQVQYRVVKLQPAKSLVEIHLGLKHLLVERQGPEPGVAELRPHRVDRLAQHPAAEADHRSQHCLQLVRAKSQLTLLRVVDQPALQRPLQQLKAPAVTDQALEFLRHGDGLAQGGRRLQNKAHHVEAGRPDQPPGVQAKTGVAAQLSRRTPQPGDVVNRPTRLMELAGA
ncbi:MAG: hypothetical protein FD135_1758 [Comamonadaceae bacterium]|nr:MAG: hypothetical protein FD135_1758 [Comamonadaceae bacterium]